MQLTQDQCLTTSSLLTATSLLLLYPIFAISGVTWFFIAAVVAHLICLVYLQISSVKLLSQLTTQKSVTLLIVILALIIILPELILPTYYKDALIHHLFVPSKWLDANSAVELSWHSWSYYPMAVQTVFVPLLKLAEQFCAVYHALYLFPLAAVAARLSLNCLADKKAALFSSILVIFTPVCLQLAGTPLVDLVLSFFCCFTLLLLIEMQSCSKIILFAGISLAAALSSKYNGLIFVFGIVLSYFWYMHSQSNFTKALKLSVLLLVTTILFYLPWPLRNFELTGNPFYPLMNSYFGVQQSEWYNIPTLGPWQQRIFLYKESLLELILLPLRMIFLGAEGNPRRFDGVASPFIILALLPLFTEKLNSKHKFIYAVTFIYVAVSLAAGPARIRYIAPVFGMLAALSAFGLHSCIKLAKQNHNALFSIFLGLQILWAGYHKLNTQDYKTAYKYLNGSLTKDDYLAIKHIEYNLIQKINQQVQTGRDCTYALYTSNAYYWYTGCVESDGYQSAKKLITWLKQGLAGPELKAKLHNVGFTHLFMHEKRLLGVLQANLSKGQLKNWHDFVEHYTTLEFGERGYKFLRIIN